MSTDWRHRKNIASKKWRWRAQQHGNNNRKFGTFSWHTPVSTISHISSPRHSISSKNKTNLTDYGEHRPSRNAGHVSLSTNNETASVFPPSSFIPSSQPSGQKQEMHNTSRCKQLVTCPTGHIVQTVLPIVVSSTAAPQGNPVAYYESDSSAGESAIDDPEHGNILYIDDRLGRLLKSACCIKY